MALFQTPEFGSKVTYTLIMLGTILSFADLAVDSSMINGLSLLDGYYTCELTIYSYTITSTANLNQILTSMLT